MARVSDLIRDSRLETFFLPDCSVETVHTSRESDITSRRRVVARSEHWKRLSKIGGGAYGSVWLEKCIKDSHQRNIHALRAVKQIDLDSRLGPIDYNRELEAIAKFSHARYVRCFVRSFGWYEGPDQLFIAMEYLELGDLYQHLYDKPPLPEREAKEIAFQILEGLDMMHENDFAHRDLKPRNILIKARPPDDWWIKIADFGISKRIEDGHGQTSTLRGTPGYVAPELWGFIERGSVYMTDIWATGEIVFEILVKKQPFAHLGLLSSYANQGTFPSGLLVNAGVSRDGIDFVSLLMKAHPKDRCTAKAALSHKWLATIAIPASEGPDSEAYSPGETSDLSPIPESKSFTVEVMTQEFASWETEELSQKTIQPRKSDPHITAFLNYEQSTASSTDLSPHKGDNATMTPSSYSPTASKSSNAIDEPQSATDQAVTDPNNRAISRKPVAANNNPTRSPNFSTFDDIIPNGELNYSPGSANFEDRRNPTSPPSKTSLSLWWRKKFLAGAQRVEPKDEGPHGVFGVPLDASIKYANVSLSVVSEDDGAIIIGYVPVIVAKCGVFLKEKATEVQDIFRLSGSSERIKNLELSFDSPPRYGKGLDWTGYNVNDVANLLLRYLLQLPEPVIPLKFSKEFQEPLRQFQQDPSPSSGREEFDKIVKTYQLLITRLPDHSRLLLLYILDLLAVFASKSDKNRMTSERLALIFQHGLLASRPSNMYYEDILNRDVLIFLIENQDRFLITIIPTAHSEKQNEVVHEEHESREQVFRSPDPEGGW